MTEITPLSKKREENSDEIMEDFALEPKEKYFYFQEDVKLAVQQLKDISWNLEGKSSDYILGYNDAFRSFNREIEEIFGELAK